MKNSNSRSSLSTNIDDENTFQGSLTSFGSFDRSTYHSQHGFSRARRRVGQGLSNADESHRSSTGASRCEDDLENYSTQSSSGSVSRQSLRRRYKSQRRGPVSHNLPSLTSVCAELVVVICLHCYTGILRITSKVRSMRRSCIYVFFAIFVILLATAFWLAITFCLAARNLCTPPPDYVPPEGRPLIEYYVHGRGIGHYERSVAIVDRLNKAGIDVRMFLTRPQMWRAMHDDSLNQTAQNAEPDENNGMGRTTAIAIGSLTPGLSILESLSHFGERLTGDCESSITANRYPELVISDGDVPGGIRGYLGGIPSVGIAHGLLFSIAQKPAWVEQSPTLNTAWDMQHTVNSRFSFFSQWQIATHFCFFESISPSGVVASAPMRPEVQQMAAARSKAIDSGEMRPVPKLESVLEVLGLDGASSNPETKVKRRKLIMCYFRDHNGDMVIQSLLSAGFDVVVFDTMYNKNMINNTNRYGAKWIVRNRKNKTFKFRLLNGDENRTNRPLPENRKQQNRTRISPSADDTSLSHEPRLIRTVDRSLFASLMHIADGIVSSGGSQLMSECMYSKMPILALYSEDDTEQNLNVQLATHDGPCRKPTHAIFGTSFQRLEKDLSPPTYENVVKARGLNEFVGKVKKSRVSEVFYTNYHSLSNYAPKLDETIGVDMKDENDLFDKLPNVADIVLEILKQLGN